MTLAKARAFVYMTALSNRIQQLRPSPTFALDAKVKQLQAAGDPVVNLGLGEPDFPTPQHICAAATQAMQEGFTHYTQVAGVPELRQAISEKFRKENNIAYQSSEIVVGVGSKQLLYNAFLALCQNGDEVIVPTPTWSTYIEQIKLAEVTPVVVTLEAPFKLKASDIEKALTDKTKIILLNSPGNPTGAMIELEGLEKIAELATARNIFVISDEIYEKMTYGKPYVSIASLNDEIKKLTITINGFSKSYAMTGWRIGYAGGPQEIIEAMISLQGQTTSCTSSIAQKAAIAALAGSQEPIQRMLDEFAKRRAFVISALKTIPGLDVVEPEGAFYVFVGIQKLLNEKYPTSASWCQALLEKEKVSVVPSEAFEYSGYFRLSFATSMEQLEEGIKKIKRFVEVTKP